MRRRPAQPLFLVVSLAVAMGVAVASSGGCRKKTDVTHPPGYRSPTPTVLPYKPKPLPTVIWPTPRPGAPPIRPTMPG